jgi:hypothetical protein
MGLWYQANRYQRGIERAHPHFYHPFTGTYQNFHPASDRRWDGTE